MKACMTWLAERHAETKLVRQCEKFAKDMIPIGIFRCTKCGFLESYASPLFGAL